MRRMLENGRSPLALNDDRLRRKRTGRRRHLLLSSSVARGRRLRRSGAAQEATARAAATPAASAATRCRTEGNHGTSAPRSQLPLSTEQARRQALIDVFVARQRSGCRRCADAVAAAGRGGRIGRRVRAAPPRAHRARLPGFDGNGVGGTAGGGDPAGVGGHGVRGTGVANAGSAGASRRWRRRRAERRQMGRRPQQFTTSNAARDLGNLIERTRAPGQQAFVYGAAAPRTQLPPACPDRPTGVVIGRSCHPAYHGLPDCDGSSGIPRGRVPRRALRADTLCAAKG